MWAILESILGGIAVSLKNSLILNNSSLHNKISACCSGEGNTENESELDPVSPRVVATEQGIITTIVEGSSGTYYSQDNFHA
jgi:hypothetical protein